MTLLQILERETQSLKEEFCSKTLIWAEKHWDFCKERYYWSDKQWCDFLGIEAEYRHNNWVFPKGFYNSKHSKTVHKERKKASSVIRVDKFTFTKKEEKKALLHYCSSLEKLAYRIEKKGLIESNIKIESASIGVNFNTVITDGIKSIRAWTIIAEGPIQKPHYRYLIK